MNDDNQYRYNRPLNNPQGYPQVYQPAYQQPPQPVFVPTPVQENGVPVTPFPEEKNWIKHFYNWTGGLMLIHIGMAILLAIIVGAASYLIMFMSTGIGFFELLRDNAGQYAVIISLATAVAYVTANLTVFGIGCKVTEIKPKALFKFKGFSGKMVLSSTAIALLIQTIVVILSNIAIVVIQDATGFDIMSWLEDNQRTNITSEIIMAIYACIGAPITEELVFRGFCLKNLSRFNQRFGIIASAFLFGLVHGNIIQFFLAFPLGILLAYITIKANSIIPAIIVHFIVNTSSTILSTVSEINESLGNIMSIIWIIATIVIGLIVLIAVLVKYKIRLPKNTVPKKKRGWPIFFSSAPLIIFTCIYGIMILLPLAFIPFLSKIPPYFKNIY